MSKPRVWRTTRLGCLFLALAGLVAACSGSESNDKSRGNDAGAGSHFSFFATSLVAIQRLSGSQSGFGGDLRFGQADGLSGADEICRQIAEGSLLGAGKQTWHAFLSVTQDANGQPVNAIDRVGEGPWYDRLGRVLALDKSSLTQSRPSGADPQILDDLPNEDGVPNHAPDGMTQVDNHDFLTGSSATGTLYNSDWSVTCHDWTSAVGSDGKPRCGHSWPRDGVAGASPIGPSTAGRGAGMRGGSAGAGVMRGSAGAGMASMAANGTAGGGMVPGAPGLFGGGAGRGAGMVAAVGGGGSDMSNWMSALDEAGCAPGVNVIETGGPNPNNPTVGSGGGYGGIYCFALTP